jgi:hypothetical protein
VPGDYSISLSDELLARNNPVSIIPGASVANRFDFNRDGTVSVIDQLLSRNNITTAATKLKQITPLTASAIAAPRKLSAQGLFSQQVIGSARSVAIAQENSGALATPPRNTDIEQPEATVDWRRLPRRSAPAAAELSDDLLELLAADR